MKIVLSSSDKKKIMLWGFPLLGFGLMLWITATYGAGVSGDAVDYLSTADNLMLRHGFIDFSGNPYISWPPLYPIVLAMLSRLIGANTFVIGWYLNAFLFGIIIGLSGLLFYKVFQRSLTWLFVGLVVALASPSFVRLSANIATDPLFIVLVLTFVLLGENYLVTREKSLLLWMVAIAALSSLLRWNGVILIATLLILVLISKRKQRKEAFWTAFWVGVVTSAPIGLWTIGRNYYLLGTLMGYRDVAAISIAYNLTNSLRRLANWFVPLHSITRFRVLSLTLTGIVLVGITHALRHHRKLLRRLLVPQNIPWLTFSLIYYPFVIATSIAYDHPYEFDDRYYTPLFIFAFLFVALCLDELLFTPVRSKLTGQQMRWMTIFSWLVFSMWLLFPAYRLYKYAVSTREHGDTTYNLYNNDKFQQSELVQFLRQSDLQLPLYSNYPAAVYFYTHRMTKRAPVAPENKERFDVVLHTKYEMWPKNGDGYLVWFLPNDWHYYYEPEDLKEVVTLEKIFSSRDGAVYWIKRQHP